MSVAFNSCSVSVGVPPPPVLVKAEVTAAAPKDAPVKKAVPCQFPLLERVKGKTSEQLKALEESFQRSSCPTDAQRGKCNIHPTSGRNQVKDKPRPGDIRGETNGTKSDWVYSVEPLFLEMKMVFITTADQSSRCTNVCTFK